VSNLRSGGFRTRCKTVSFFLKKVVKLNACGVWIYLVYKVGPTGLMFNNLPSLRCAIRLSAESEWALLPVRIRFGIRGADQARALPFSLLPASLPPRPQMATATASTSLRPPPSPSPPRLAVRALFTLFIWLLSFFLSSEFRSLLWRPFVSFL
jgi:hypothetical protein